MTKSVTIVNTSNWEGENIEVEFDERDTKLKNHKVLLKPGESECIGEHHYGKIVVKDADAGDAKPFMRQVLPILDVKFKLTTYE